MVEVTQADREAAARLVSKMGDTIRALNITCGNLDDAPEVQAFARHRINALRSLADDQAMVEQAARAMCREGGFDPNEIMPNDGQRWRYYVPAVQAALRAIGSGQ